MDQTAVLMIDMQNSYIAEDGMRDALGWPPIWRLEETVAACAGLLAAAREQGLERVRSRVRPAAHTSWPPHTRQDMCAEANWCVRSRAVARSVRSGSPGVSGFPPTPCGCRHGGRARSRPSCRSAGRCAPARRAPSPDHRSSRTTPSSGASRRPAPAAVPGP